MPLVEAQPFPVAERPWWAQALALFGSFATAPGLGAVFGAWAAPGSDLVWGVQTFALLVVFIAGMAAWGAIAASIMARAIFSGDLMAALLRFFLRGRRKEDLPRLETRREVLLAAARRVFGWTRVFPILAVVVASVAAPVTALAAERTIPLTACLSAAMIISYGLALRALARRGYLIPPDLE